MSDASVMMHTCVNDLYKYTRVLCTPVCLSILYGNTSMMYRVL